MARILGIKCKLCRREGRKLFLKATRCSSGKCPIDKKGAVPPGAHGRKRSRRPSEYSLQLREKQKGKRIYGISEKQMKRYFNLAKKKAGKTKGEKGEGLGTGDCFLRILEMRLDNVVFRAGFVPNRPTARQLVSHGHVLIGGKKVDIPSYEVKVDQVITLSLKGLKIPLVGKSLEEKAIVPKWLKKKGAGVKVCRLPNRDEIDADLDEQLILEFYSR